VCSSSALSRAFPSEFLALCQQHRQNFKELAKLSDYLIELRQSPEDVLLETGDIKLPDDFMSSTSSPSASNCTW
jgi:hypothetical protein